MPPPLSSTNQWNQDHRNSGPVLQRQFSQDLTQPVATYFQQDSNSSGNTYSLGSNAINQQQPNMTSQQFNATMAFQGNNNNNADGWDDWDWNENPSNNTNPNAPENPNKWAGSGQAMMNNNNNSGYGQQPDQQLQPQYNNYQSYQQPFQAQYQQQQQQQPNTQSYHQQNTFQQYSTPSQIPPPDHNPQSFNWNLHANFRTSPTTSTEVQQGHSRSTSNASSEMIRTESMNSYDAQLQKPHLENNLSRMPDVKNNTPQQLQPQTQQQQPQQQQLPLKQNPQMARILKTDALSPQWSMESQVSQTSSERSIDSNDNDSRSSATITSDEGGFYSHHHTVQQAPILHIIQQKANIVQEVKNVSEHEALNKNVDPNMDKLDQALFEMNVLTPPGNIQNQDNSTFMGEQNDQGFVSQQYQQQPPAVVEQNKEATLPPPPMMGNQPNFNQAVKLPSHTPSPPPVAHPSQSMPPKLQQPAAPIMGNLPPPPLMDNRGGNPYKRTGHAIHHNVNFQSPNNKLPSIMPHVFYPEKGEQSKPDIQPPVIQQMPTMMEQRQQPTENYERPIELPRQRIDSHESSNPDIIHARGRGSMSHIQSSPRRESHTGSGIEHHQSHAIQPPADPYRPIDPSYISPRHNQVQYIMPSIEREQNQAVGQNLMDQQRHSNDSDRSQHSPHTRPDVNHSPAAQYSPFNIGHVEQRNTPSIPISDHSDHNNQEIVPNNDRNEYLQTGHLSEDNYHTNVSSHISESINDNVGPPPGLSRYVLGQPENSEGTNNQEPPPGLDRMVPGTDLENSTQLNMAREADGQVTDMSSIPPARNYSPPRSVLADIEITDRNLYTVPGESGGRSSQRRIVPGVEDDRSPTMTQTTPAQISPQIQIPLVNPEPQIPEQERELAVEGENLLDQQASHQNEMTREDPIEGADTFDEGIVSTRGESESNQTLETGRKETSTNEDSDRPAYYRTKKPQQEELHSKLTKSKEKERYNSSDSENDQRRNVREGSVRDRESSINNNKDRGDRASGRRKEKDTRDIEKKHRDDRHER